VCVCGGQHGEAQRARGRLLEAFCVDLQLAPRIRGE
jgi:hypothetical protein